MSLKGTKTALPIWTVLVLTGTLKASTRAAVLMVIGIGFSIRVTNAKKSREQQLRASQISDILVIG